MEKTKSKQKIQKVSDKKWLISAEQDTWTDDEKQATLFKLMDEVKAESILVKKYKYTDFDVFDAD